MEEITMEEKTQATQTVETKQTKVSRRALLGTTAGLAGAGVLTSQLPGAIARIAYAAGSDAPIRIGFQVHRTGIGALYGRWYERTTNAAAKYINGMGGIAGRPVEVVAEDDGTDPKRGAGVVEKLASQHKVDFVYGTLFSHVVMGSAPRAGELKIPYFVVSEGYHVASGALNRYTFQPCITDVRSQITAMAGWLFNNLGKKVALIYPDYAFGYDHRDYASAAAEQHGGKIFGGKKLDDVAGFTLGLTKSGEGAMAPILYRAGRYAELFDYCARDVWIESKLVAHVLTEKWVENGRREKVDLTEQVDAVLARVGEKEDG